MFTQPEWSPWGKVQVCDPLCPGVYLVSTASHGGTMVAPEMLSALSPAARKCGMCQNGWLCFEEYSEENIVLRELLDKKMWKIPERIKDKAAFEEEINNTLRQYHPDYWRARQAGIERAARRTAPASSREPEH